MTPAQGFIGSTLSWVYPMDKAVHGDQKHVNPIF